MAYDRTQDDEDQDSEGRNLILLAYEEFVQDLAQIFRDVCKSKCLHLQLVPTWSPATEAAQAQGLDQIMASLQPR